jgi:hypothetical protein
VTAHFVVRPALEVPVPPAMEYETLASWVASWPEGTTVLLEGRDGAVSRFVSREDLIDGLAMRESLRGWRWEDR